MATTPPAPRQLVSQVSDRYRAGWRRFWSGFTSGQKATTVLAVAGLVIAVIVLSTQMTSTSYQPLFTGLQPQTASQITAKLTAAKVPYQLTSGGATVEVPAGKVDQERLAMAAAGLPQAGSGAGLSILDKEGITTSQFTQQADYQRAIQDELEQTIDSIQGVQGSQVEIVMPSDTAFALGNNQTPSASVMLQLQAGTTLSPGQVSSVAHLVASAVPNLTASAVTVADNSGALLYGPGLPSSPSVTPATTVGYDNSMDASLSSMLDQIVGPGNAVVRVSAVLNSATSHTVTNGLQLSPKGATVSTPASVKTTTERFAGTGAALGGVLGTNTTNTGTGKSTYSKASRQTSYETGVSKTTVDQPPGQVASESVSVVLSALPKGVTTAKVRQAVSAAAGLTPADTISVVRIPFSNALSKQASAQAKQLAAAKARATLVGYAKTGVAVAAILVALVVLWRKSKAKAPTPVPAQTALAFQPAAAPAPALTAQLPAVEAAPAPQFDNDAASRVLRAWMDESNRQGAS